MASVVPSVDQAAGLLKNLSMESQSKTKSNLDLPEPNKKAVTGQIGSGDLKGAANGYVPVNNHHAVNPLLTDVMDPSMCYVANGYQHAYYYGGYDGTGGEWDDYSRYINQDGSTGVYGDNGALMYHPGYGYAPYGPYSPATSPVPTAGHDSQLYGHQQYQYPSPYFSPMTQTAAPTAAPQVDLSSAASAGQLPMSVDTAGINTTAVANGGGKGTNGSAPFKPDYQNSFNTNNSYGRGSLPGGVPTSAYQDPGFGYDGLRSPIPWIDGQAYPGGQLATNSYSSSMTNGSSTPSYRNQSLRSPSNGTGQTRPIPNLGTAHGYMNRLYPSKLYGQYGNAVRTGMTYGSNDYYQRSNSRGWFPVDSKYKNRGRPSGFVGYGSDNMDGMNELNRGPRAKVSPKVVPKGFTPVTLAVRGQSIPSTNGNHHEEKVTLSAIPEKDQYNLPEFPDTYSNAKFFIIKSYSEDDIHKSIKYNVWSSTPNGNKKLDAAYREAQEKSGGCPVFLFFSVNASGQFVGLAEMVGSVDFEKSVEYWQQDKWNGNFSLKWHIVKDVPNSLLKHIILENNENKPVTNSRDTQEVKLDQGLQMIKLFKEHSSKTCILDDFGFYEGRQKMIQEKKAKQQQFQKQVWEGKNYGEKNKDGINGEQKPQKVEVAQDSSKEAISPVAGNGEAKLSENGLVTSVGEVAEIVKPVLEKTAPVSNGVGNGY